VYQVLYHPLYKSAPEEMTIVVSEPQPPSPPKVKKPAFSWGAVAKPVTTDLNRIVSEQEIEEVQRLRREKEEHERQMHYRDDNRGRRDDRYDNRDRRDGRYDNRDRRDGRYDNRGRRDDRYDNRDRRDGRRDDRRDHRRDRDDRDDRSRGPRKPTLLTNPNTKVPLTDSTRNSRQAVPPPPAAKNNRQATAPSRTEDKRHDLLCIYPEKHDASCRLAHTFDRWQPKRCTYGKGCSKKAECSFWHSEAETKEQYLTRALRTDIVFFHKNKHHYIKTYRIAV